MRSGVRVRRWLLVGVVCAVVAPGGSLGCRRGKPAERAAIAYLDSVVVMPVANLTGDSAYRAFADELTYGVISELHTIGELKVPSYLSVQAKAQAPIGARDLADTFDTRLVLAAQLRREPSGVKLDLDLVDGLTDETVAHRTWPVRRAGGRGDIETITGEIVALVAAETGVEFTGGQAPGGRSAANEPYLLGKQLLSRRTPSGVRLAIRAFAEAIVLQPDYAPAYEGLASAYNVGLFYRYELGINGYAAAGKALAALNRAIELDGSFAPAYAARGYLTSRAFGPTRAAAADFARALELAPNSPDAVAWSGYVMAEQGEVDRALRTIERGVALDPYSPARYLSLAYQAFPIGRYDVVIAATRRVAALEPDLAIARALEGYALLLAGRPSECLAIPFGPHDGVRALCLFALGRRDSAAAIIDSISGLLNRAAEIDVAYTAVARAEDLAAYYAWTGNVPRAMDWIEYAFKLSPIGIERRVLQSRLFESVRRDRDAAARLNQLIRPVWSTVEREVGSARLP